MSAEKFQNPVVRWIDHRLPIFSMLDIAIMKRWILDKSCLIALQTLNFYKK